MTRIRNPFVFGASLLLLASAVMLGLRLHDDGVAVGATGGHDDLHLQGDLVLYEVPEDVTWDAVRSYLDNRTYLLHGTELADTVLVTGAVSPGDDRVVHGTLVFLGADPEAPARSLAVVEAESVDALATVA